MTKAVLFNLGPSTGLATRTLVITRHLRAGDDSPPAAAHSADAGAVTTVSVTLADNTIWQAVLTDVLTSSEIIPDQVLSFQTGDLSHLGPKASGGDGTQFYILNMEDLSSSSSSSSPSSSSSVSSSSPSSSSVSSPSSSSVSSNSSSISSSTSSSVSSSSVSSSSDSSSSVP